MKKIYLLLLIALPFLFQSCLMDDKDVFQDSAAERMNKALIHNQEVLMGATNGWMMEYFPHKSRIYGGYTMFLKFEGNDKVTVASERGGAQTETSSYQLIGDSGPVLTFNTYNTLFHYFSEPKNPDGIGPGDSGMAGDYEFLVLEATPEKVTLKGKKTGNRIVMTPIPVGASWVDMMKGYQEASDRLLARMYSFTMGELKGDVTVSYRTLNFTYEGADKSVETQIASYRILPTDEIEFYEPLKIGGKEISKMKFTTNSEGLLEVADATSGLTLQEELPILNQVLVYGNWYFQYSAISKYGQNQWDLAFKSMHAKGKDIYYAYMGIFSGYYGFCLSGVENNKASEGVLLYDYKLLGTDQVKLTITLTGTAVGNAFKGYGVSYILETTGSTVAKAKTFTLVANDRRNPTAITWTDNSDPNNSFTLFKNKIYWPYEE